jgi:anti-anti-sigma factor
MFDIQVLGNEGIRLSGRFDASQAEKALAAFNKVETSCDVDFQGVDYISSAGLGVLLETQQRLSESGHALRLVGMNPHVRLVFEYAGFDHIFDIA